ncbi:MAG: WecB/TagA/CpsF family glycosyltransferase [Terriglobales bacterium]
MTTTAMQVCGVRIDALDMGQLTDLVEDVIRQSDKRIFGNHNLHSLYLCSRDERMREFYRRADYVHADGMSLIALARLSGVPLNRRHRVTYADWTDVLIRRAHAEGWRVFYLGAKPGVAARGAAILRSRLPGLNIETAHGYIDTAPESEENRQVVAAIRRYRPNLLLVGMGMPRQEHWVLENLQHLDANAILLCGAAMDYIAGVVPTPPRWAGRIGLEWLFRLYREPRRLWRRYLVEPWLMLWMLFRRSRSERVRPVEVYSPDRQMPGD